MCVSFTQLKKAESIDKKRMIQPDNIAQTVLFVLAMTETASSTEITILPQRSPYV